MGPSQNVSAIWAQGGCVGLWVSSALQEVAVAPRPPQELQKVPRITRGLEDLQGSPEP